MIAEELNPSVSILLTTYRSVGYSIKNGLSLIKLLNKFAI